MSDLVTGLARILIEQGLATGGRLEQRQQTLDQERIRQEEIARQQALLDQQQGFQAEQANLNREFQAEQALQAEKANLTQLAYAQAIQTIGSLQSAQANLNPDDPENIQAQQAIASLTTAIQNNQGADAINAILNAGIVQQSQVPLQRDVFQSQGGIKSGRGGGQQQTVLRTVETPLSAMQVLAQAQQKGTINAKMREDQQNLDKYQHDFNIIQAQTGASETLAMLQSELGKGEMSFKAALDKSYAKYANQLGMSRDQYQAAIEWNLRKKGFDLEQTAVARQQGNDEILFWLDNIASGNLTEQAYAVERFQEIANNTSYPEDVRNRALALANSDNLVTDSAKTNMEYTLEAKREELRILKTTADIADSTKQAQIDKASLEVSQLEKALELMDIEIFVGDGTKKNRVELSSLQVSAQEMLNKRAELDYDISNTEFITNRIKDTQDYVQRAIESGDAYALYKLRLHKDTGAFPELKIYADGILSDELDKAIMTADQIDKLNLGKITLASQEIDNALTRGQFQSIADRAQFIQTISQAYTPEQIDELFASGKGAALLSAGYISQADIGAAKRQAFVVDTIKQQGIDEWEINYSMDLLNKQFMIPPANGDLAAGGQALEATLNTLVEKGILSQDSVAGLKASYMNAWRLGNDEAAANLAHMNAQTALYYKQGSSYGSSGSAMKAMTEDQYFDNVTNAYTEQVGILGKMYDSNCGAVKLNTGLSETFVQPAGADYCGNLEMQIKATAQNYYDAVYSKLGSAFTGGRSRQEMQQGLLDAQGESIYNNFRNSPYILQLPEDQRDDAAHGLTGQFVATFVENMVFRGDPATALGEATAATALPEANIINIPSPSEVGIGEAPTPVEEFVGSDSSGDRWVPRLYGRGWR